MYVLHLSDKRLIIVDILVIIKEKYDYACDSRGHGFEQRSVSSKEKSVTLQEQSDAGIVVVCCAISEHLCYCSCVMAPFQSYICICQ